MIETTPKIFMDCGRAFRRWPNGRILLAGAVLLPADGFDANQPITWDDAVARLDGKPWPKQE